VLRLASRPATLIALLVLIGGPFAECGGWLSTPEARMVCCANEQECPMHKADRHPPGSMQTVSQSDADRCCATSEPGDSLPSTANATRSVESLALIPAVRPVALVPMTRLDDIYEPASNPPTSRSRHVLLSVFLI
jgi:hypothetical protein